MQRHAYPLCTWAALSVAVSMYNKWILGRLGFNYPMVLSFAHMVGAAIALNGYLAFVSRRARRDAPNCETLASLPAADPFRDAAPAPNVAQPDPACPKHGGADLSDARCSRQPTTGGWARGHAWWLAQHGGYITLVAAMFATSVCLRNSAFAGLPLPVMQLLGSCAPLGTYILSAAVGLVSLTLPCVGCLLACILGVAIAVSNWSTAPFSAHALARHAGGIGLEICRGVVLQLLIRKVTTSDVSATPLPSANQSLPLTMASVKSEATPVKPAVHAATLAGNMHKGTPPCTFPPLPTVLLAMYSPVCAGMVAVPALRFELPSAVVDAASRPLWFWIALAGNVVTALALNMAAVTCLHRVGVVALSLTGFIKDWGLLILSTAVFGLEVSPRFVLGMMVTTAAVGVFGGLRRSPK